MRKIFHKTKFLIRACTKWMNPHVTRIWGFSRRFCREVALQNFGKLTRNQNCHYILVLVKFFSYLFTKKSARFCEIFQNRSCIKHLMVTASRQNILQICNYSHFSFDLATRFISMQQDFVQRFENKTLYANSSARFLPHICTPISYQKTICL